MRRHTSVLVGYVLVLVLLFFRILFGGQTFYFGDNTTLFMPLRQLAADAYRHGTLPLWNPYSLSGTPLLADAATGALSPFIVFYLFLTPQRALALSVLLALLISALGVYFFVWWRSFDRLRVNGWSAILAGLVWMVSGTLMERTSNTTVLETLAFLPWMFAFCQRFITTERRVWLLPAALSLAMAIFAGYLPLVILFLLVWAAWMIAQKQWGALAIVGGLGLGLAALQLIPFMEFYIQSTRSSFRVNGLQNEQLSFLQLPRLVLAWFYGVKHSGSSWGIGAPPETGWASTDGYVGTVAWVVVLISLKHLWKKSRFWVMSGITALVLAMGTSTFLGAIWQMTPILSGVRPNQWLAVFTFIFVVLMGDGLTVSLNKKMNQWWAVGIMVAGAVGWSLTPLITSFFLSHFNSANYPFAKAQIIIHTLSLNVLWMGLILLLWHWRQKFGMWCVVMAVIVDGVVLSGASIFTAPDSWYSGSTPLVGKLASSFDFNYRFISWAGTDPYSDFDPLFNQVFVREPFYHSQMTKDENQNLLILQRKLQDLPPNGNVPLLLPTVNGYVGMVPARLVSWWQSEGLNKISVSLADTAKLSQAGVKYALIVAPQPILPGWGVVDTDGYRALLVNDQALPRAHIIEATGVLAAAISEETATRVVINANTKTGGQLVLADSFYPGWEVVVDGAGALITPYQNAWRQVALTPGDHTVEFQFRSPTVSAGKWISAGSLFLMVILFMIFWEEKNFPPGRWNTRDT